MRPVKVGLDTYHLLRVQVQRAWLGSGLGSGLGLGLGSGLGLGLGYGVKVRG